TTNCMSHAALCSLFVGEYWNTPLPGSWFFVLGSQPELFTLRILTGAWNQAHVALAAFAQEGNAPGRALLERLYSAAQGVDRIGAVVFQRQDNIAVMQAGPGRRAIRSNLQQQHAALLLELVLLDDRFFERYIQPADAQSALTDTK